MRTAERGRFAWFEVDGALEESSPPLILIPAGPGFSHLTLREWFAPLADQTAIVSVDLPGTGRGSLDDGQDYAFAAFVRDVEQLRTRLGIPRLMLAGHGWGASLAVEYAIGHRDAVAGLILVSPIRTFDMTCVDLDAQQRRVDAVDPSLGDRFTRDVWPAFEAALNGSGPWEPVETNTWWSEMVATQFADVPPARWHEAIRSAGRWGMRAYGSYKGSAMRDPSGAMARYDLSRRAALLPPDLPMLIVSSDHDANYVAKAASHALPLAAAHPAAELAIWNDVGHFAHIEQSDRFLSLTRSFLSRCLADRR